MDKSIIFATILLHMINIILAQENQSCYEGQVNDKIAKADAEIKELKQDLRRLEETVIAVLAHRWEEMVTFRKELRVEIATGLGGTTDKKPRVAFTANDPAELHLEQGREIIFKTTVLNEGGGYNASNGVFTAPINGLYQFTVQVCNAQAEDVAYAIIHGGKQVALGLQYQSVGSSCSSANAIIIVAKNEKVWIKCTYPGDFQEDIYRRAAFMGVLLH